MGRRRCVQRFWMIFFLRCWGLPKISVFRWTIQDISWNRVLLLWQDTNSWLENKASWPVPPRGFTTRMRREWELPKRDVSRKRSRNYSWERREHTSLVSTPLPGLMCTFHSQCFRLLPHKSNIMIFCFDILFFFHRPALRGKRDFNPTTWVDVYH